MRKLLSILFAVAMFCSCSYKNYEPLSRKLQLGITKQEALGIMGNSYFVESSSQTSDEKIEVLHFKSDLSAHASFLLHFVNDKLIEFHRYVPEKIQVVTTEKE